MSTIATIRPYTKPSLPTLTDDSAIVTDSPATGVRSTKWSDFRAQLSALYPLRSERNAANGHAGIAADGLIEASILRAALVPEEVANDAAKDALVIVAGDVGRRLVRVIAAGVNPAGTNYLARATGSGADKWIVYNTAPAASETVAGVAEIANDAEIDAETDDARIVTSKKAARAVRRLLDPVGMMRQAILSLAVSDGLTANRRFEWTMGAAGNVAGSALSEVGHIFRVPTANVGTVNSGAVIWMYVADYSNPLTRAYNLKLVLDSGTLALAANGATGLDFRVFQWPGFRAAYSGQIVRVDAVILPGTANPVIYINGFDRSSNFTVLTGGTPPDWISPSLIATFRACGFQWPSTEFRPGVPINRALTADDVSQMAQTGALLPVDRLGGYAANRLSGNDVNFAGGPGNWTTSHASASGGVLTITSGTTDLGSGVRGVSNLPAVAAGFTLERGRQYYMEIDVVSATAVATLRDPTLTRQLGVFTTTPGRQRIEFLVSWAWSDLSALRMSVAAASSTFAFTNVRFGEVGALLQSEITRTAQVLDHGPNRIRGIATAGIRPLSDRDPVGIRGNITATGNILGLGASDPLWFETGIIRAIRIKPTANAATTVTYRLNTSGGTVIGTLTTSTLNQWVTLPFAAGTAFEVSAGDKIHITTDAAHDFDIEWSRR